MATIAMPILAEIIDLGLLEGQPCIWAIIDPELDTELRRFEMVADGFVIPKDGEYIGSLTLIHSERLHTPMHFFEVPVPEETDDQ